MEIDLNNLGNIEFLKCFLAMHYKKFDFFQTIMQDDPRSLEYIELSNKIISKLDGTTIESAYDLLCVEALKRGLKIDMLIRANSIYSHEFKEWETYMRNTPTYIREIQATNFLGNYDISYATDEVMGFDYPVREACKILNDRGYRTYWSSANIEDYLNRKGEVIKDKSVAYILINYQSLDDNLKKKLLLDGECNFWGIAKSQSDNGKYYGIWSEITSKNMLCSDISNNLTAQALELPLIEKQKVSERDGR